MATCGMPAADLARYRELVRGSDLGDEEKDHMIQIVANIMKAFAESAFRTGANISNTFESKEKASQADSGCDSFDYIETTQSDPVAARGLVQDSTNVKDVPHGPASPQESSHLLPR